MLDLSDVPAETILANSYHVHHVGASRPRAWDIWSACVIANGTQMDDSWWRYGHTPGPALIRIALYHPQYLSSPAAQTFAREYAPWLDRLQTASTVDDAMFTDEEPNQEQRAMRKIARLTEIMAPQAGSFDLPSEWTP